MVMAPENSSLSDETHPERSKKRSEAKNKTKPEAKNRRRTGVKNGKKRT